MPNLTIAIKEKFRELERRIQSITIQPGQGYMLNRTVGGTTLNVKTAPQIASTNSFFRLEPADEFDEGTGDVTNNRVRVYYSTLADEAPDDFYPSDNPPFLLDIDGPGVVFAHLEIDGETGEVTGRTIENDTSIPENTDTDFYCEIGTYDINDETDGTTVAQGRYGPIGACICRNWFDAEVSFGVTFS